MLDWNHQKYVNEPNHVTPIVKSFKTTDVLIIIDILGVQIFL